MSLDIREKKSQVIKAQKYQEAAILRDTERTLVFDVGKLMVKLGISDKGTDIENIRVVEGEINRYLESKFGISYSDQDTSKTLKSLNRQLKLSEILKD